MSNKNNQHLKLNNKKSLNKKHPKRNNPKNKNKRVKKMNKENNIEPMNNSFKIRISFCGFPYF